MSYYRAAAPRRYPSGALLAGAPDALVVQTYRAPELAIASVCGLNAQASAEWSETFLGETVGRDQFALWARGLETCTAQRARHDQARFWLFVADPLVAVAALYDHFGLTLSDDARVAMRRLHTGSTSGARNPSHRYRLASFCLSTVDVTALFAATGAAP